MSLIDEVILKGIALGFLVVILMFLGSLVF